MAQHIPIENFPQKAMRRIEESIRKERFFRGSLKFEKVDSSYNENEDDMVFLTHRRVPKSIAWFKPTFEIHTKPVKVGREATKIYLVT